MSNRVDYAGRAECGCPYINQPDPGRHWKGCHYRLNSERDAKQVETTPAPEKRETVEVVGYTYAYESGAYSQYPGEDWLPLMTVTQHERIVGAPTRPAQKVDYINTSEQQPIGYANYRDGRFGSWLHPTAESAANFDKTALSGKPAGSTQVALYAAPITQTEPAPAQDEQEIWSGALLQVAVVLEALRSSDSATRLANMDAGKVLAEAYAKLKGIRAVTRPTQKVNNVDTPEQQPVGYQYQAPDGDWFPIPEKMISQAQAHGYVVRPIYATPIAQTEPAPAQDEQEATSADYLAARTALESCDWSRVPIGTKEILGRVVDLLWLAAHAAPQPEQSNEA